MVALPPGGALHRVLDPDWMWGSTEELQALTVELLDRLWRQQVVLNSKKGARQPEPLKIPRPWQLRKKRAKTQTEKRAATLAEIGNFLQGR